MGFWRIFENLWDFFVCFLSLSRSAASYICICIFDRVFLEIHQDFYERACSLWEILWWFPGSFSDYPKTAFHVGIAIKIHSIDELFQYRIVPLVIHIHDYQGFFQNDPSEFPSTSLCLQFFGEGEGERKGGFYLYYLAHVFIWIDEPFLDRWITEVLILCCCDSCCSLT